MSNQMLWCGHNGFNQFSSCNKLYSDKLEVLELKPSLEQADSFDFISLFSYNAFRINNKLYITGAFPHNIEYDDRIKKICGNDHPFILVLLENGDLYQYFVETQCSTKLDILAETSPVHSISSDNEMITDIGCGAGGTFNIAVTNKNSFYKIPTKCFDFDAKYKIVQICCGNEHLAILNANGNVYMWGSGLRGQHGTPDVIDTVERPVLIKALRDTQIVQIACGGWHVAAISKIKDLYIWGWNSNGQLGNESFTSGVPSLISLNDLDFCQVACGIRHTVVKTDNGKLFSCGWNKYGQLGVPAGPELEENQFGEIQLEIPINVLDYNLKCGNWSTVLIKC